MKACTLIELASETEASYWGQLLAQLNALQMLHLSIHWKVHGKKYYSDHLLFMRLYEETSKEIDPVAEKSIGTTNDSSVIDPVQWAVNTADILARWWRGRSEGASFVEIALTAERGTIQLVEDTLTEFGAEKDLLGGIEDLLQGIISTHESHIYLLQQRVREDASY